MWVRRSLDIQPALEADPLIEQAQAFGASASQLARMRGDIEVRNAVTATHVDVWPANWHAVLVFAAMGTQWRREGDVFHGLDYASLPPVLDEHRKRLPRRLRQPMHRLMPQLRTLEDAARPLLNTPPA